MKKVIITTLVIMTVILTNGMANKDHQDWETSRVLAEKTFDVKDNAELVIDHEFGTLECKNWDKDQISVTITAFVDSDNEDKIRKAIDRIRFDLSGNSERVAVSCKLENKGSGNKNPNVAIDVKIFMPKSVRLNVKHKFGKAFIEEANGASKVISEYGSITVNALNAPESKLKIAFGEGKLGHFSGGAIDISYSKFRLGSTGKISIHSEYSDVSVGEATQVSITQEGGDFDLDQVDRITGSSSYSELTIGGLTTALNIETKYGSLVVKNISKDFSDIVVENRYGSGKLYIDDDATYTIDARSVYGSIDYPESLAELSYREKTISKTIYKGVIGKEKDPRSTVTVKSNFGSIDLIAD